MGGGGAHVHIALFVYGFAQHVEDAAQGGVPTGTLMGAPPSTTSMPRTSPSVELIATARTWESPSSCCTSQVTDTSLPAGFFARNLQSIVDFGHFAGGELRVHNRANDLRNVANVCFLCSGDHACAYFV